MAGLAAFAFASVTPIVHSLEGGEMAAAVALTENVPVALVAVAPAVPPSGATWTPDEPVGHVTVAVKLPM